MQPQFTRHVRGGCLRNQKRSLTAGAIKGLRCLRNQKRSLTAGAVQELRTCCWWLGCPAFCLAVQSGRAGRRRIACLHESFRIGPLSRLIPEP